MKTVGHYSKCTETTCTKNVNAKEKKEKKCLRNSSR